MVSTSVWYAAILSFKVFCQLSYLYFEIIEPLQHNATFLNFLLLQLYHIAIGLERVRQGPEMRTVMDCLYDGLWWFLVILGDGVGE